MKPAERIELSARALGAAGYEVAAPLVEGEDCWRYWDKPGDLPRGVMSRQMAVPDLTTPENLGRVVEMVDNAPVDFWSLERDKASSQCLAAVASNWLDGSVVGGWEFMNEATDESPNIALLRAFIEARGER